MSLSVSSQHLFPKCLLLTLLLTSLQGCWGKGSSQTSAYSSSGAAKCAELPQGTLNAQDVKAIALTSGSNQNSGMVKAGKSVGFSFDAQAGQTFNYQTDDNICLWVFTPDNQLMSTQSLPKSGKYTVQISTLQGSTTFNLAMSLDSPQAVSSADPSFSPIQSAPQPASVPPLVETETQRVSFEPGATGASLRGNINATKRERHLLQCGHGQSMSVQIQSGNVTVTVTDPDGQAIGTLTNSNNSWRGVLPSDGDYGLEVSGSSESSYLIQVEVL
jgi:hypothetical protein